MDGLRAGKRRFDDGAAFEVHGVRFDEAVEERVEQSHRVITAADVPAQRGGFVAVNHRAEQPIADKRTFMPRRRQLLPDEIVPGEEFRPIDHVLDWFGKNQTGENEPHTNRGNQLVRFHGRG